MTAPGVSPRSNEEVIARLERHAQADGDTDMLWLIERVRALLVEREDQDRLRAEVKFQSERADMWRSEERITRTALGGELTRVEAERDALAAENEDLTVALGAVEALLPNTDDEQFPIFPQQIREALGTTTADVLVIPHSSLAGPPVDVAAIQARAEALAAQVRAVHEARETFSKSLGIGKATPSARAVLTWAIAELDAALASSASPGDEETT